jgi:hypothetical protein
MSWEDMVRVRDKMRVEDMMRVSPGSLFFILIASST